MKLIELEQFLKEYNHNNTSSNFDEFYNFAQVRQGIKLIPLKQYIEKKKKSIEHIKELHKNILLKEKYLTRFYNTSLKVKPEFFKITKKPMENKLMNNNIEINYKNIIRNIHYKDILENTTSGIDNIPTYLHVLTDLYKNNIIDYKLLTPSALLYINKGRIGSVFSSFYFRASIMNPYLVYSLNENLLKGTKIFTPTLGWTSYLFGFLESAMVKEYVGTDVIPDVCSKTQEYSKQYNKKVKIYCKPSEDLLNLKSFARQYKEHFDVVFFSPPYYKLELYSSDNQSTDKYDTYEKWLNFYWEETIKLAYYVLERGGRLCYILSGYGSENVKQKYDLIKDMNNITRKYFSLKDKQLMYNKNVNVTKHKETNEMIMYFVKD
tara:strand:- start:8978 stop:10111 length:1134 start_codon:yes stop_codon:yes gene_type:complete